MLKYPLSSYPVKFPVNRLLAHVYLAFISPPLLQSMPLSPPTSTTSATAWPVKLQTAAVPVRVQLIVHTCSDVVPDLKLQKQHSRCKLAVLQSILRLSQL